MKAPGLWLSLRKWRQISAPRRWRDQSSSPVRRDWELSLVSLQKKGLRGKFTNIYLKGEYKGVGAMQPAVVPIARTTGCRLTQEHRGAVWTGTQRQHFCAMQVAEHWHRSCLAMAMGTLLWVSLLEQGLGRAAQRALPASAMLWFCNRRMGTTQCCTHSAGLYLEVTHQLKYYYWCNF